MKAYSYFHNQVNLLASIIIIAINFTSSGCSLTKASVSSNNRNSNNVDQKNDRTGVQERPAWINAPLSECQESLEICAVGEGMGGMEAEANARKAIALIFEAKIQGKKTFTKSTYQREEQGGGSNLASSNSSSTAADKSTKRNWQEAGQGQTIVDESSFSQIEEVADAVLSGIQIRKKYEDRDAVFAYAVMDKIKVQRELKRKIELIDEKMVALQKEGKRGVYRKLIKFDELREEINRRYQFLSGQAIPKTISFANINQTKNANIGHKVVVLINIDPSQSGLKDLLPLINKLLHEQEYSVLPKDHKSLIAPNLHLTGNLQSEEQFLNVPGFKRYRWLLSLQFERPHGEKIATTEHSVVKTGRSYEDAYAQALAELREYLAKEWDGLGVE